MTGSLSPAAAWALALERMASAGLALCRYILRLEPLASLPAGDVVATIAPSVPRYLTQAVVPAVPLR